MHEREGREREKRLASFLVSREPIICKTPPLYDLLLLFAGIENLRRLADWLPGEGERGEGEGRG